ncbi:MAG: hypothetical protein JW825_03070 [Candidatus Methanofastidiosa archaeon]|nr:hypothetical protein [Candidatus Methanofastidiosa archaeon]
MFAHIFEEKLQEHIGRSTAFFRGEVPDRIPAAPMCMGQAAIMHGYTLYDFYTKPELGIDCIINAGQIFDAEILPMWIYATYWVEDYGGKLKMPVGRMAAPAMVEPACKTLEDAENLEVLDLKELDKGPTMQRHWRALEHAKKIMGPYFSPWSFPYEVFVQVAYWVGPERAVLLVKKDPKLMHRLLKKAVEHCVNVNTLVAEKYGSSFIICSSLLTSNTLSRDQCIEFNMGYLSDMINKSLKNGAGPGIFYHLCGDHRIDYDLHKDVPITPATIMHVAYDGKDPMDINKVMDVFGDKCVILGNTDTALMQLGTPAEVYDNVKAQVLAAKESPKGFMAGNACEIPPFAPPANTYAFVQAVKDFGQLPKA